jgi:hypothetical protein
MAATATRLAPPPRSVPALGEIRGYEPRIPASVKSAFASDARSRLERAEPVYRDVASHTGVRWELLAACDWMQCHAHPRHSPVYGERLGSQNPDGTCYRTRSAALERCAGDLIRLSHAVYGINLTARERFSISELAGVFAAYRWGGLLRQHHTSVMEFPYSVAGLTVHHTAMRWPNIDEPRAPDRPGSRFRMPFGAVPAALLLGYHALA